MGLHKQHPATIPMNQCEHQKDATPALLPPSSGEVPHGDSTSVTLALAKQETLLSSPLAAASTPAQLVMTVMAVTALCKVLGTVQTTATLPVDFQGGLPGPQQQIWVKRKSTQCLGQRHLNTMAGSLDLSQGRTNPTFCFSFWLLPPQGVDHRDHWRGVPGWKLACCNSPTNTKQSRPGFTHTHTHLLLHNNGLHLSPQPLCCPHKTRLQSNHGPSLPSAGSTVLGGSQLDDEHG